MTEMPRWNLPKNIAEALADGDGVWEDERWSPIRLTAMGDTEYEGREIPVAWQIEFDPYDDEFETANAKLKARAIETDGYAWGEIIRQEIGKADPESAKRLHLEDCKAGVCVIWVESEDDCRKLMETTWRLVFDA